LGKSVHLNRPGEKHNSGFGLPQIPVTKITKKIPVTCCSCRDSSENCYVT